MGPDEIAFTLALIAFLALGALGYILNRVLWEADKNGLAMNCKDCSARYLRARLKDWEVWVFSNAPLPEMSTTDRYWIDKPKPPLYIPEKTICTGRTVGGIWERRHYKIVQHERWDFESRNEWWLAKIRQECREGQAARLSKKPVNPCEL